MKRWYTRIISLLLCLALAATLIPNVSFTVASSNPDADGVYHISNFADFMGAVGYSRTEGGNTLKYVLENDIEFTPENVAAMQGWDIDHLTFGDRDHFFLGEFDGQGHTISGLNYANNLFKVATRTGLFSFVGHKDPTEAAKHNTYIHDLTIKGADMHADYCSGILAGEAYNTRFENISIVDSSISVNPADNTLVLITDGGVYGGALAGYAEGCKFYNCESRNTTVRTNSVSGVAALSGKPLYLGGLVGDLESSEMEYCRVMKGEVKNRYESSVGALGGFTAYAGGLAGQAGGLVHRDPDSEILDPGAPCKIVDCFASCNVSFYVATYVGVGAGCAGHAGGLVGKVDDSGTGKTGATIKRCHYAGGEIGSYQYNTLLLMIPVQIAHDVNRSGLVDIYEPKTIQVYDSYFNYTDGIGPDNGKPANVLGDKKTSAHYGPQADERYMDRAFWENRGYDFAGNLDRSDEDGTAGPKREGGAYYNKWVMYYYDDPVLDADGNPTGGTVRRGYPVHGLSLSATLDFPGAGEVTLSPTLGTDSLSHASVSTRDPYHFAVLGFYPTEQTVTTYTDGTPTKGGVGLSFAPNEGYRWTGWYLVPDVAAAGLPDGQHAYFEKVFADPAKRTALTEDNGHIPVKDNQLYVAQCQARVRFYDVNGGQVDVSDANYPPETAPNDDDDWYYYHGVLPGVVPQIKPASSTATLIGWTTVPNMVGGVKQGYPAIDTVVLGNLRRGGNFYAPNSLVEKTMDLYPVYADLISNITTRYEGNELDTSSNETLRTGYGETSVTMTDGVATIHVTGSGDAGAFPDGVRFLGWYELGQDAEGHDTAHLVSREQDFTLTDVDLTAKHTYEARFEYRVRFWLPEKQQKNNSHSQYTYLLQDAYVKYDTTLFLGEWESTYLANFRYNDEASLTANKYTFSHWTDVDVKHNPDGSLHTYDGSGLVGGLELIKDTAKYDITQTIGAPLDLYAIFSKVADFFRYSNYVTTDFPLSATVNIESNAHDNKTVSATVKSGYNYIFWDMYGKTANAADSIVLGKYSSDNVTYNNEAQKAIWATHQDVSGSDDYTLYYTAHMTADVNFHQAVDETQLVGTPVTLPAAEHPYRAGDKTVSMTRRYRSPVFGAPNNVYDSYSDASAVRLTFDGTAPYTPAAEVGQAPSREDMAIPGYYFVGWLEKDAWTADDLSYFLDVANGTSIGEGEPLYQSSSIGLCKPYVLPDGAVVEHAMDLYPVYVKYHIDSATSVVLAVDGVVQKPTDPTWDPEKPTADKQTLALTAYNNVAVRPGEPDGEKYTIEFVTVTVDDGEPAVLYTRETYRETGRDPDADWTFTYDAVPGKHYLFTAVYKPYVVVFHRNGNVDTEVVVRDYGRPIAVSYLPTVQDAESELNYALFVGWTEKTPGNGLYHFTEARDGKTSYELAQELGYWTLAQTEDTLVTHSMELWPVYATYTVTVNSNIDQELLKDTATYPNPDALREKVRTLNRESANTVSTTVKAQEVEGYKFVGWYTGVKENPTTHEYDDFTDAVAISEAGSYTLEGGEPFTDKLYTARYKAVYKVIYHNRGKYLSDPTKDPVIYTNYLYEGEDEDKALNMWRTDMVDQPVLDSDGNPVLNPDGTVKTERKEMTYHQPLDPVPYHMIYATMDEHESFGQWECHEIGGPPTGEELVNVYPHSFEKLLPQKAADGTVTDIGLMAKVGSNTREINLYPTVWRVTVLDSHDNDITGDVRVDIDMSGMDPTSTAYDNVKVYISFDPTKPYTQNKLTVRVQRTRWVETEYVNKPNIAIRGRNDVEVFLYADASRTEATQLAPGQMTHNKLGLENNEANDGYAVFELGDGLLRLTKNAPKDKKGETFLFRVTDTADTSKTWRVAVKCDDDLKTVRDDGTLEVVGSTGETFLRLPPGVYSVTEVGGWAWRQEPMYEVYVGGVLQEAANAHQAVPVAAGAADKASMTEGAKVVCRNNTLAGNHWLVKTADVENLFNFGQP